MKMNLSLTLTAIVGIALLAISGCKKTDKVVTLPAQAHFLNKTSGSYSVTGPTVYYKIAIGTTTVSEQARTVKISITSPTGAQPGVQYTAPTTLVIPAGKAVDSLEIRGVFAQYQTGRKDTLVITIQDQDVAASSYNKTFTLVLRGPCFEPNIVLSELLGTYANTNEVWGTSPYGPYTTTITAVNQLTATTGTITVANIFDDNWTPLVFTLDWTNPAARKVTLVAQVAGGNAADAFGPTYNGIPFAVRPVPASAGSLVGTFSYCNETLVLKMQIGISGVGYSPDIYTVNMAR